MQVRRAIAGRLTREAEQAFLLALSATCNVTLAAKAVGASPRAFYRRKRQDPGFAREMRLALQMGYERLEMALLESGLAGAHEHDDWRRNDPAPIPPMTPNQALQLMYLHQKEARLIAEPWAIKRMRGENSYVYAYRLAAMAEERHQREIEKFEIAEAERWARGEAPWGPAGEDVRNTLGEEGMRALRQAQDERDPGAMLPDLSQVTGWSRASPVKIAYDESRALFGGWRMEQLESKRDEEDVWV